MHADEQLLLLRGYSASLVANIEHEDLISPRGRRASKPVKSLMLRGHDMGGLISPSESSWISRIEDYDETRQTHGCLFVARELGGVPPDGSCWANQDVA